ncbi:MAG: Crp/Fnr family transcriptional regulator [Streptomyces sp.]|nr:Crp/Fnr family transcriptional regulator [Streptomyces sp.]NUS80083.1 Crp/Fnr family transcriptional regulator [Streptomyces sp.]
MTEIHITEPRYPPQGHGAGIPSITRFRTADELVGEAALITSAATVATRCLTRTAAIPCAARYFAALLERRLPQTRHALLCSLEDRNRSDEAVYAMAIRPPLERVSHLLAHLADTAGIPDPDTAGHIVITGPGRRTLPRLSNWPSPSPRMRCAPCATTG